MNIKPQISIILPCLNEEKAISSCLDEIRRTIKNNSFSVEVIVVDNDSTDNTASILSIYQKNFPELVIVNEKERGYGFAYLKGLSISRGEYIFMADSDGTYNFSEIPLFIDKLKNGFDLVIGDRFSNRMEKDSMPWSHKYIGNPILSSLVRLFFGVKIHDIHCGARAITREALSKLNLYTGGMEFASEMIINAKKENLKITEVSIEYRVRVGESKLNSLADGWRHLRFILLYSPLVVFLLPGLFIFLSGIVLMFIFYFFEPIFFGIKFYTHPIFLFSLMIILGYQLIVFSLFSKIYAITHLGDKNKFIESIFSYITLEKIIFIGIIISIIGIYMYLSIFRNWINSGFGSLDEIKGSIVGLTIIVLGVQTFFSSFMFSILGIKNR
jgi:glycosyltransferase involved in cell wall biosynthesis